jgi:hypothetical protein
MTSSRILVWTCKSIFLDRTRERARVASSNMAMVMMGEGRSRHGRGTDESQYRAYEVEWRSTDTAASIPRENAFIKYTPPQY